MMEEIEEVTHALVRARTNFDRWSLYYSLPPISSLEDVVLTSILAHSSTVDECLEVWGYASDEILLRESLLTASKFVDNEDDFLRIFELAPDDLRWFLLSRHEVVILRRISRDDVTNQYLLNIVDSVYIPQLKQSILRIVLENEPSSSEVMEVYLKSRGFDGIHENAEAMLCSLDTET